MEKVSIIGVDIDIAQRQVPPHVRREQRHDKTSGASSASAICTVTNACADAATSSCFHRRRRR
jgi:hypothetical protein